MSTDSTLTPDRYLLIVLGGPQSGKDTFIDRLDKQGRLGHYVSVGPKLADNLPGIEAAREKTRVHPEKLPEMIDKYDATVRATAIHALKHNQNVVLNGHGEDISRIQDIVESVTPQHRIIIVGVIMPPEDLFRHVQERVESGRIAQEDQQRIMDFHKTFRTNLSAFAHMADITLVFNREHGQTPKLATIYETGVQDVHRTVLDQKGHYHFRRWQHVDTEAKTLDTLVVHEPEARSAISGVLPASYTQAQALHKHRDFAEKLLGVSIQQERGR